MSPLAIRPFFYQLVCGKHVVLAKVMMAYRPIDL